MRVLDIDLDLFLADTCPLAATGERPVLEGHEPWGAEQLRRFLEENCGLDRKTRIPGRIFDTHDKALLFWQEQLAKGTLKAPFEIVHADAHSDLGIGFPGPGAVLNGVLPVAFPARTDVSRYYGRRQLDEANYLLFALAFRYASSLVNIRNPRSKRDFPEILREGDGIRLSSFASKLMEGVNGKEPFIPYCEYPDPFSYRADGPFKFVTCAQSPRYAPKEADALLDVISDYIEAI